MKYTTKPFYKCSALHINNMFPNGYCIKHNKEYFNGIDNNCNKKCFIIKVTTSELKEEWKNN